MDTLIKNTSGGERRILKKAKLLPDTDNRLHAFRIKQISDTGRIITVDENLEYIIEKGLEAVGFGLKSA